MPGLDRILDWVASNKLKKAVVTNAPRANAKFMLEALKLTDVFPCSSFSRRMPPEVNRIQPPYQLALKSFGNRKLPSDRI